MQKLCLAILDGFGINETLPFKTNVKEGESLLCLKSKKKQEQIFFEKFGKFDAVQSSSNAKFKDLMQKNPHTLLVASGESVGLPKGQMGNSEVGHLNIGAGKIVLQDLLKISKEFESGNAENNEVLKSFFECKGGQKLHIVGLASNGNVHSSQEHLKHLIKFATKMQKKVCLHLITDGRDTSVFSGQNFIKEIESVCGENAVIASISGRYFAMDREKNQDRTQKYFSAVTGEGNKQKISPTKYVEDCYQKGISDEFLEPVLFDENLKIQNGDKVLFFNFRADRMRQIVSLIQEKTDCELFSFTEYSKDFKKVKIVFEKENKKGTLSEILSNKGLTQLKVAEVSKYAHITYFLNGGIEKPFANEDRILVEMVDVPTFDLKPEMSAEKVTAEVVKGMEKQYDFICVNYANCDMVGHTGNFSAAQKAVEIVTGEILKLFEKAREQEYVLIVTADHGNAEIMQENGEICTSHTTNRVPFAVLNAKKKIELKEGGALCNIMPTILDLMEI